MKVDLFSPKFFIKIIACYLVAAIITMGMMSGVERQHPHAPFSNFFGSLIIAPILPIFITQGILEGDIEAHSVARIFSVLFIIGLYMTFVWPKQLTGN